MNVWNGFVLAVCICTCVVKCHNLKAGTQPSLRLVQILFRHGDRTPVHTFPTDPHQEKWMQLGLGQLTKAGKEQHYEFGQYIRQLYKGFLNESYLWNEVMVNSTNMDRTLMSAASHLAGLFPPVGDEVWNVNVLWQPIPIHTTNIEKDYLLNPEADCPKYDDLAAAAKTLPEFQSINQQNSELLKFIANKTGCEMPDFLAVNHITDNLRIDKIYNLSTPSWLNESLYSQMQHLSNLNFNWYFYTQEMQLLRGGPLLGHMIDNMNEKMKGVSPKKLFLFSSHDTAVTAFLMNLNVYNDLVPPYTAAVIVELHQTDAGYHVQLFYRNESWSEPHVLHIPECDHLCPFETFISLTQKKIPYDIEEQCKGAGSNYFSWTAYIAVIVAAVVVLAIIFVSVMCWKRKQETSSLYRYMIVNGE